MKHSERWLVGAIAALCVANVNAQDNQVSQQAATRAAETPKVVVKHDASAKLVVKGSVAEGVELTKRAQASKNVAEKQASLHQAEEIYTNVLKTDPKQGAALNNLAVLAVGKGDTNAARDYFERAIASDDGHKALYALNYSKYLQKTDKPAAIKAARVAAAAAPDSAVANEHLGELLWQTNPAEMLPLANDLVSRGHTELATRFALQCLTSQSRPAAERQAWLILLASRLAKEYEISDAVRESIATDLSKVEGDPEVGRGSSQLRAVISAAPQGVSGVDWWARQTSPPSGQNLSGRNAMRNVLLAAGEFHSMRDAGRAAQYLRVAIDLGDEGFPDPDAFLRLVELYASSGAKEPSGARAALAELMNRYQFELFTEKGKAYREGNWPLIYRMHVALGMTYAYLNIWKSNNEYQNGIFQLSNAMRAAERASTDRRSSGPLALPPVGVVKLAEGYSAIGREDLALKTRIDGATALNKIGHVQDSRDVFSTIPSTAVPTLDDASRAKYEALRTALPGL